MDATVAADGEPAETGPDDVSTVDMGVLDGGVADGGTMDATSSDAVVAPDLGFRDAGPVPDGTVRLQLISISDWHGQLDPLSASGQPDIAGAAVLSSYFARERATNPNTLIVAGGDSFGGTPPLASFFDERPAVEALNAMGLDVDTFGNHNFDKGVTHLQQMINLARFKFVSSNLENLAGTLTGVVTPYHLVDIAGVRVAFIGITNDDAPTLVFPGRMGPITVANSVTAANTVRAQALAAGARVFVGLVHMGATTGTTAASWAGPLIDFARGVSGFDVIFGDHTDLQVNMEINGALVVENRSKGRTYARVELIVPATSGGVVSKNVEIVTPLSAAVVPDPMVETLLAPYRMMVNPLLDRKIGVANGVFPRGNNVERLGEVAIGNLLTDAMRLKYGTQIALTNGGGIRAPLPSTYLPANMALRRTSPGFAMGPPYDLVLGDAYTVLPFGNAVVTRIVTGTQLWAALEHGVSSMPMANGRFPQISGFRFTYTASAAPGSRVLSVTLDNGTPIARDATTYTMATMDFVNTGGDGYAVFNDGSGTSRDLAAQVLADHITQTGTITPMVTGRTTRVFAGACGAPRAPRSGELLLNELLADPAAAAPGDANGDGTRDGSDDEFIELINTATTALRLDGVVVSDTTALRHTFGAVNLGCGQAIVIFGGGNPQHAAWRPNWVVASAGALGLNNDGDTVKIGSAMGTPDNLMSQTYGAEANVDQSLVRQMEGVAAAMFIQHTMHPSAGGRRFSPGTRVDGSAF